MSESDFQPDSAALSAGANLRHARERAGLHVAALAATLKVPVRQIEALEAGDFNALHGPSFVRALAASVCRVLKIDPAPILAQLPVVPPVNLGSPVAAFQTPMPSTRVAAGQPEHAPAGRSLGVPVAVALLVVAVVLWFALPLLEPQPSAPALDMQSLSTAEPSALLLPPQAPALAEGPPSVLLPAEPVLPAPAETPVLTAPTPAPVLQLSAQQTAWIEVTGASGRVWLRRSLQPGESVAFDADWPLQLVVGRVDAVSAILQGQALDLAPHSRNNVARLQVSPSP